MKRVTYILWALSIVLCSLTLAYGQTTVPGTRGRVDPVQRELQRRFESEAMERALAEGPTRRDDHERRRILAQIKTDFLRLQIVNEALQKSGSTSSVDVAAVAKAAGDINKLAGRLKVNLAFTAIENGTEFPKVKADVAAAELRQALSLLNQSINSFVENPVFERSGVVDAQLSLKAAHDLERIIAVSRELKRSGDRLKRARS